MKRALDFTKGSEELPPAKVLCQRDCDSMASSSSSTSQWTYDVFLSFSGEDTRYTATDFIYYVLEQKGIHTFKDDEKLEKGKAIESELFKAIKESRFAVVILSKNYASSTWCLNELVEIIACEKMGMTILPIFYDVDPSDVRKQKGTFAHAFDEYEKQFKEKVRTWRDALNHVANIAGYHVDKSPLSTAVEGIAGLISRKLSGEFSEVTEGLIGIESSLLELELYLAFWLKDEVRFIGIWAMGGMGKTTLAKVAYKMFSKEFEACCFIDNVREKYEKEGELSLQKNLISQILNDTNLNIKNKCEGEHMIKNRLRGKRILLVLDDVNDLNQLQKLAGKCDWFGRGSRIIITTRDKRLLETHLETRLLDKIYEVQALKFEDALHLFCSKAFKNELVPDEYLELSKGFLNYVDGHPLALIVLGSFLFKRSVVEWENEFEKLKEHPKLDVIRVLKISYDGLEGPDQEIFKDIACFFNHEKKDYVEQILKILGRYPNGLRTLIEKSLLKISENNYLWMHDLLRDMGRDIVCQESCDEPGKRSRLWHYEDIDNVLKNDTGTEKVQAMDIRGAKDTSIYHEEKEACWGWVLSALPWQGLALLVTLRGWVQKTLSWRGFISSKKQKGPLWNTNAFLKLSNLKFLRIRNICPQQIPEHLPNSLRYLDWSEYPAKLLPCFQPDELVQLCLPRSKIELLWRGMKNFDKLKFINMAGSSDLIVAPDFGGVPNLEKLVLFRCSSLCKLHPSIGKLKKLKLLDLEECQELTSLPDKFEMESLVTLNLTHCLKVKKIPEFVGNMELLQELLLRGTAIIELPSSVECLTGLNTLILQNCKNLVCLSNTICSLTSLNNLDLSGCSKVDKLPKDLGNIISLKKLDLSRTAIKELPSSIEFLIGLEKLDLIDCKKFVLLPSTVCSLKSLKIMHLSGCPKLVNLPENLGNLKHLWLLCFDGTAIEVLPSSVGRLAALKMLDLKNCKNLVCLPSTICNLKRVWYFDLTGCSKITNLPENLWNMESLKTFYLGGTAIKELPSSTIHLKELVSVTSKGCQLSSSSLTSVSVSPVRSIDLSDCNLLAIPSGIDCLSTNVYSLYLRGNNFVSLPESISQFSELRHLFLGGCKSLRSLPNTPSKVVLIDVDNCTSLERLPEPPPNDFYRSSDDNFEVRCLNCFKLADNIQNFSNMFQVQSNQQFEICYTIPGREIPKWFEKVNICDTSVHPTDYDIVDRKVKIQLPGSGLGCDEWRGIVLCVLFLPTDLHHRFLGGHFIGIGIGELEDFNGCSSFHFRSEYGKVESQHLWLHSVSKNNFHLPKTPGCYIDKKGFHQVELEIQSRGLEVEKIGFCVV